MRKHHLLLAASAAMITLAAETGSGSGGSSAAAGDNSPSQPSVEPGSPPPPAEGLAKDANPNAPTSPEEAAVAAKEAGKGKRSKASPDDGAFVVWVQPGHDQFGIGQLLRTPNDRAEMMRGAGRVRYASEAEIKAAKEAKHDVPEVESF